MYFSQMETMCVKWVYKLCNDNDTDDPDTDEHIFHTLCLHGHNHSNNIMIMVICNIYDKGMSEHWTSHNNIRFFRLLNLKSCWPTITTIKLRVCVLINFFTRVSCMENRYNFCKVSRMNLYDDRGGGGGGRRRSSLSWFWLLLWCFVWYSLIHWWWRCFLSGKDL